MEHPDNRMQATIAVMIGNNPAIMEKPPLSGQTLMKQVCDLFRERSSWMNFMDELYG
ncbi:MAG: hypothetical protein FJY09_06485 [Chlorobi bacterium]|nr:hypothetical protein [Chlorobiota bacterium]